MKALVIISRDLQKGSTQYRFVQYESRLQEKELELEYIHRKAIDKAVLSRLPEYDVVINQKCLFSNRLGEKIRTNSRRLVFDMDDAVYTRPGKPYGLITGWRVRSRLHWWLRNSDVVTVANEYLGAYAKKFSRNVKRIPMTLDLKLWHPVENKASSLINIGWSGSPANVNKLEAIGEQLAEVLASNKQVRLAVYSGKRPNLPCEFDYTPYEPGTEVSFVQQLAIGLLPLPDDEFSRGKSPIKSLQYLACGVPVVGNNVGASAEILRPAYSISVESLQDWPKALNTLLANPQQLQKMGQAGRTFIEQHHNLDIVAEDLYHTLTGQ